MRLIEKTAVDAVCEKYKNYGLANGTTLGHHSGIVEAIIYDIESLPTIEAEPVRQGEWEFGELDMMGTTVKCSVCGFSLENVDPVLWLKYPAHKFCGCCGAKMDGKENEE